MDLVGLLRSRLPACDGCAGVALSGGPDSSALLDLLIEVLGGAQNIVALHVDHGVREASSRTAERAFVADFCARLGVHLENATLAAWNGGQEREIPPSQWGGNHPKRVASHLKWVASESDLREARYRELAVLARRQQCSYVILGHHQDDQVETVLMQLLRGADLRGLTGMRERFELDGVLFLRPLLDVARADLQARLEARALPSFEDPTNLETSYRRNRLRRRLLPWLDAHEPGWRGRVSGLAASLREVETWKRHELEIRLQGQNWDELPDGAWAFPRPPLVDLPAPLLKDWCRSALELRAGRGGAITRRHVTGLAEFAASHRTGYHPQCFPGGIQVRGRVKLLIFKRMELS